MSAVCILAVSSLIVWIVVGVGRCPVWVAGILTALAVALGCLPLR